MKKKKRIIIGCLIVLAGLFALNYPLFAEWWNNYFAYREVKEIEEQIRTENPEVKNRTLEQAQAYNAALAARKSLAEFAGFALIQPGALVGYIEIPQIGIRQAVRFGTDTEVIKQNLGILEDLSLPVGGKNTHSVISGHSGMASRRMLTDLGKMREGDIFFLHCLGQDLAYQVDKIEVVEPWDDSAMVITPDQDYVTLLTCTPYGINDHRLLVRGTRIDYDFEEPQPEYQTPEVQGPRYSTAEQIRQITAIVSLIIITAMLVTFLIMGLKKVGKRKK